MAERRRVAYVVNHAAFFVSHRLPLALAAQRAGFEVALFTGRAGSDEMESAAVSKLAGEGIKHRRTISRSSGVNPLIELIGLLQLMGFILKFRPDVVHCASPKGNLYGGIAARICRVPGLVLAISGMGYAYTSGKRGGVRQLIQWIQRCLADISFRHPNVRMIVQNEDDRTVLVDRGQVPASKISLIPGSGVHIELYAGSDISAKKPLVLLPARMLRDKGVCEFVAAARQLKSHAPEWQFVLAGAAGYDNPSSISEDELLKWNQEGVVKWIGHVDDITPLFHDASIVCLPSYREGMPKALLEAAAAGCAVVTSDVVGCREAIEPGVTGELVPARDINALTAALSSMIGDKQRRKEYGERGRRRAMSRFSVESVTDQVLNIYRMLFT